jgi:6-pyruvoyltetrahydropterin/6-carboxytetrahydropterin synthase
MSGSSKIQVRHNAEIAHRLLNLPGKCQRIHGHSLSITLEIGGDLNEGGILGGMDFGTVKDYFRKYIDGTWDHHLHLNVDDPWAKAARNVDGIATYLPGMILWEADPTTENIARWIAEWALSIYGVVVYIHSIGVFISETNSNGASYVVNTTKLVAQ